MSLCIFLTYGTTARVSRLHGAGHDEAAHVLAAQALWLALAIGVAVAAVVAAAAPLLVGALGGDGHVADMAVRYLRIAVLGLPMALIALAGQGWLRGIGDLRSPLVIVVAANAVNIVLELLFVYGFGLGPGRLGGGTVLAQLGMGAAFAALLLRAPAPSRRPNLARIRSLISIGAQLFVRTAALLRVLRAGHRGVRADRPGDRRGAPDRLPALRLPRARARRDRDRRAGHRRPRARRRRRGRRPSPPPGG